MGKKIAPEMEAQHQLSIGGAAERGVDATLADHVFDQMAKFAGYGFNKSHAAYALLAHQTAYLTANYRVEFPRRADDIESRQHRQAQPLPA
jgi:DNA polymerase III subunit alpha